ncbi:MAG TPA: DUF1028 domain-containing protein [Anaerolineae bacterium]|nr:DUF1028 domain-containing protein [Anaerolineae bacterium]
MGRKDDRIERVYPPRFPLAHTFSIVARDPQTGRLGVAVQSHRFSVGSVVARAEAGVGAVATQSLVEVSYGPLGLALMRAGKSAAEAMAALLAADEGRDLRQVAMVDARGRVATHTGARGTSPCSSASRRGGWRGSSPCSGRPAAPPSRANTGRPSSSWRQPTSSRSEARPYRARLTSPRAQAASPHVTPQWTRTASQRFVVCR